jgi:hypothetical protein
MEGYGKDFQLNAREGAVGGSGVSGRKAAKETRPPAKRNWAWAPNNDSYDWMDTAGPFAADDMAE